ncbi:Flagellar transcriptional activator FlhC [Methylomonas fluvii]|uniref:FlhC family transcriptional regulator n=1 Tax=Methylomonas fluvii TaxID=1854564 RepID=UPI0019E66B54|nr:FlhC family transcriptional regulator [Methylomonas fluvii]CAD6873648.1 Flagellar transcriptional activator FlhC [Methylomonas fluvii]
MPIKCRSNIGADLLLAKKLIQLGARPPIVSQLCHLTRKQSIAFFKTVQGKAPKQGMLPHDHQWAIRSAFNNIHASLFLSMIEDIRQRLCAPNLNATLLVAAYEIYSNVTSRILADRQFIQPRSGQHYPLDINRAWYLISLLSAGDLVFMVCGRCRARYLGMIHPDVSFSQCPICEVWTDRSGRRRWVSAKSKKLTLNKPSAR